MSKPIELILPRHPGTPPKQRPGPCAALYILVSDDNRRAKVGLLELPTNASRRLADINRKLRKQGQTHAGRPCRMVVVGEIDGLGYFTRNEDDWLPIGHQVQAMEHAVRLVISAVVDGYDDAYEWLRLDGKDRSDEWWAEQLLEAWAKVLTIAPPWP